MKAFSPLQNLLKSNFRQAFRSQKYFSDVLVTHKNDPTNTSSRPFEFTPENWVKAREILAKYPTNYKKSASIPLMMLAQEQEDNFLSLSAMKKLAYIMECPEIDIFEVASFYTMFNRERVGKHHLQVCGTTPCQLRGSREIIKACENHLGIHCGETTSDGLYTLVEVNFLVGAGNLCERSNAWERAPMRRWCKSITTNFMRTWPQRIPLSYWRISKMAAPRSDHRLIGICARAHRVGPLSPQTLTQRRPRMPLLIEISTPVRWSGRRPRMRLLRKKNNLTLNVWIALLYREITFGSQ